MCSIADLPVGRVFELFHDDQSKPPKPKISVVVGISNDQFEIGTVFINSDVNMYKVSSQELIALQYHITPSKGRQFISHQSFVDCSEIKQRNYINVCRAITTREGRFLGTLPQSDIKNVLQLITSADSIPNISSTFIISLNNFPPKDIRYYYLYSPVFTYS